MGYFSELAIDVIEMYQKDGLKEADIARITGCTVEQVHQILADFEDSDYSVSDTDADPDREYEAERQATGVDLYDSEYEESYADAAERDDYDDSMDGDFDSAMASAGFGTDEDYGDFGGEDY